MSEFTIRSESVDVEQIMKQIRQRILEKRGQDYTEDQIRELASVRLEKFLDPKNLRSDLLEQFRKSRPAIEPLTEEPLPPRVEPPYQFDDQTLFTSHRGAMRLVRRLLRPLLKLFFNPNTLNQVLHAQAQFNLDTIKRQARLAVETRHALRQNLHDLRRSRNEWNALYYEVLHNMVLETTRMGIEVQNLRMKVESLSSRLDFSERRVRALEGVVQYRPEAVRGHERREERDLEAAPSAPPGGAPGGIEGFVPGQGQQADGSGRRRRRRRRGRRGQGPGGGMGIPGAANQPDGQQAGPGSGEAFEAGEPDGPEDDGPEEMEAGGFDVPEPGESDDVPDSPLSGQAPETSAFALEDAEELRRDKPDTGDDEPQ